MKLKPEYQAIVDDIYSRVKNNLGFALIDTISSAVERCQALADRPPLMLTDDEIERIADSDIWGRQTDLCRLIEAAHIKKQSTPETVPFDFTTWQEGGWVALNEVGIKQYHLYSNIYCPSMMREST